MIALGSEVASLGLQLVSQLALKSRAFSANTSRLPSCKPELELRMLVAITRQAAKPYTLDFKP